MKIAIFSDLYAFPATGGVPSSIRAQKNALEKMGHEVVIFSPGIKSKNQEKNVIIIPTHKFIKINQINLAKRPGKIEKYILKKYAQFYDFDLVHVHYEASCSIAGVRLARRFGLPLVQTMHGREDQAIAINVIFGLKKIVASILVFLHSRYIPRIIKIKKDDAEAPTGARAKMWGLMVNQAEQADLVLAPSEHFAKKLQHYGVTKKVVKISNGVNEGIVQNDFEARIWKEGEPLHMIWNSRVSREKRMLPFLEGLRSLKRDYVLDVYGDGNELKKAQKFVKKNNLNVHFYGYRSRSEILTQMQKVHLAIMASYDFDTQGMTLLEAQATGLPVFFCDPAMQEVVPDGSYIMSAGPSPEKMVRALEHISPAQIKIMSETMLRCRKDVLAPGPIKKMEQLYRQLIT